MTLWRMMSICRASSWRFELSGRMEDRCPVECLFESHCVCSVTVMVGVYGTRCITLGQRITSFESLVFFSTNTPHSTLHIPSLSPHSSTASPNSSITVITVILRFSRSNARLPASLTIPEVAIAARIAALPSAASARFDHKFMSPATPATMSPCPPQRRREAGLSLQTTSMPSEIRSMAPF